MKLKITKSDGTVIEAEGTVDELQKFAQAVMPVPFVFAGKVIEVPVWTQPTIVPNPTYPNPTYPNPIMNPDITWGKPIDVPSVWCQVDAPLGKYESRPVCKLPDAPFVSAFTKVC